MEAGIYKELLRLGLDEYLDIRKNLPEDLNDIPRSDIKKFMKPSDRTFEEVY